MRWWYTYTCAPSSITRGRRADHDKGCGWTCTRSTKEEITDEYRPQGAPCPQCGKKQRLNAGIVKWWAVKEDMIHHASEANKALQAAMRHLRSEEEARNQVRMSRGGGEE